MCISHLASRRRLFIGNCCAANKHTHSHALPRTRTCAKVLLSCWQASQQWGADLFQMVWFVLCSQINFLCKDYSLQFQSASVVLCLHIFSAVFVFVLFFNFQRGRNHWLDPSHFHRWQLWLSWLLSRFCCPPTYDSDADCIIFFFQHQLQDWSLPFLKHEMQPLAMEGPRTPPQGQHLRPPLPSLRRKIISDNLRFR